MYIELKEFVDTSANWFGAIGFFLTIFTAIKVAIINRSILAFNKKHLFQIRSEEHIDKLKDIASSIALYLSDFANKKMELREQLKKSEEIAKSIKKKVIKKDGKTLYEIINEAKKIQKLPDNISSLSKIKRTYFKIINAQEFSETNIGQYYIKLTGLITYLEELKKDNENSLIP